MSDRKKFIYNLRLRDGCYYVGTTTNLDRRLQEHFDGVGSAWTREHPPIEVASVSSCSQDPFEEDNTVRSLMQRYGIDAVRGGSYVSVQLSSADRSRLEKEIRSASGTCFRCGRSGHFVAQCPFPSSSKVNDDDDHRSSPNASSSSLSSHSPPRREGKRDRESYAERKSSCGLARKRRSQTRQDEFCSRCGRTSHSESNCYARFDVDGRQISCSESEEGSCSDESTCGSYFADHYASADDGFELIEFLN